MQGSFLFKKYVKVYEIFIVSAKIVPAKFSEF